MKQPALLLFGLVFVTLFAAFFPGNLSYDGYTQLVQALEHDIQDWHSPVMTWLWTVLNQIYVGPALFLLIDLLMAAAALYMIFTAAFPAWKGAFLSLIAIVFFPTNFVLFGTVSKDGLVCPTLLLALAFVYSAHRQPNGRRLARGLAAMVLIWFAMAVRPDAVVAALPICFWLMLPWWPAALRSKWAPVVGAAAGAVATSVVFLFGIKAANDWVTKGRHAHPEQVTMVHDLAAISLATGRMLFPESILTPGATLQTVRLAYDPADCMPLIWSDHAPVRLLTPADDPSNLSRQWFRQILTHPTAYLAHRARIFRLFLGFGREPWTYQLSFSPWEDPPAFYVAANAHFTPSLLVRAERRLYLILDQVHLARPWLFIVADVLVIFLLWRRVGFESHEAQLSLVAAASGLFHVAFLFWCVPAPTVRYALWLILSATVSLVLCIHLWSTRARLARDSHRSAA